jgi:hypothetical protein
LKISKEIAKPFPPPMEYHLVLTEEEYQVLKAAVSVAEFSKLRNRLDFSCPIVINRPDDILYKLHNEFEDWKA